MVGDFFGRKLGRCLKGNVGNGLKGRVSLGPNNDFIVKLPKTKYPPTLPISILSMVSLFSNDFFRASIPAATKVCNRSLSHR